jgi:Mn2+/Fe2+ NRAMP family transporter
VSEGTEASAKRFSSIVLVVIVVVLALSLTALYQAYELFLSNDPIMGYYLLIGIIGLALSTYMLFQTRRRVQRFTLETQPITTTIVCPKCNFKNVRNFERGDYILKELGPCTKCEGTMIISAIYREIKEKRKEEKIFT